MMKEGVLRMCRGEKQKKKSSGRVTHLVPIAHRSPIYSVATGGCYFSAA